MSNNIDYFTTEYKKINETNYLDFQDAFKSIIQIGYIVRSLDEPLFNFISSYERLFFSLFSILGFHFHSRKDIDLYYVKTVNNDFVKTITKDNAIVLLTLRSLYEEEREKASLHNYIEIKFKDLNERLVNIGYDKVHKDRVRTTSINDTFRWLRSHNIIRVKNQGSSGSPIDDTLITIYPSIEVILDFKEMQEVIERKNLLVNGVDDNEDD